MGKRGREGAGRPGEDGGKPPRRTAAQRRAEQETQRAERLAVVLALEVRRIVEDVSFRKGLLMEVWSRMRLRRPLIAVLRSRYDDVPATDLVRLPTAVILRVEAFYRVVDELRLYVETTEDMPNTLRNVWSTYATQIEVAGIAALASLEAAHGGALGPPPAGPPAGALLDLDLPPTAMIAAPDAAAPAGDDAVLYESPEGELYADLGEEWEGEQGGEG